MGYYDPIKAQHEQDAQTAASREQAQKPLTQRASEGSKQGRGPTIRDKLSILQRLGYAIPQDAKGRGVWGKRASAAWRNYQSATKNGIDPMKAASYWSQRSPLSTQFGKATPRGAAVGEAASSSGAAVGKAVAAAGNKAGKGGRNSGRPDLAPSGAPSPSVLGMPLSEGLARQGARPLDATLAGVLAGMQFDPAIHEIETEAAIAPAVTDQNIHDIHTWFNQVLGSQKKAGERDAAINDAGESSMEESAARILSSLGGEANTGAGVVGAAGIEAVGTLKAIGTAQEQYNADLAPLLQVEAAGAKSREQALGSSRKLELASKLASLKGQRGQAEAAARFDIDRENNSIRDRQIERLMQIRMANNALSQQEFQNQLAATEAEMAALLTGAKVTDLLAPKDSKPGHYPFAKAPVSQRNDAYQQALSSIFDADAGKPRVEYPQAVQTVRNTLNGYGWSFKNPAVRQLALQIMRDAGYNPDPRNFGPVR